MAQERRGNDGGAAGRGGGLRRAPISGDIEPRRRVVDDDADDHGPSVEDLERFSGVTRTCASCGKEVFDDAEECYHCGGPVAGESSRLPRAWVVVIVALVVLSLTGLLLLRR